MSGRAFGKYTLLEKIEGGMAEIRRPAFEVLTASKNSRRKKILPEFEQPAVHHHVHSRG